MYDFIAVFRGFEDFNAIERADVERLSASAGVKESAVKNDVKFAVVFGLGD